MTRTIPVGIHGFGVRLSDAEATVVHSSYLDVRVLVPFLFADVGRVEAVGAAFLSAMELDRTADEEAHSVAEWQR